MTTQRSSRTAASVRPPAVALAAMLLGFVIVGNVVGRLLPDSEGEIGLGIVCAVIGALAASACSGCAGGGSFPPWWWPA